LFINRTRKHALVHHILYHKLYSCCGYRALFGGPTAIADIA